ncbi:hypothetical protein [Embleya sp. NPDC020630]|uniref:hypothetical protein n=1 Tax=Embleya sp. NPDC020630 TaxID=3363979 RepID=UPI0037992A9A
MGSENMLLLWDVTDPDHPRARTPPPAAHNRFVKGVAFDRSGDLVATANNAGVVQLWVVTAKAAIRRICTETAPPADLLPRPPDLTSPEPLRVPLDTPPCP